MSGIHWLIAGAVVRWCGREEGRLELTSCTIDNDVSLTAVMSSLYGQTNVRLACFDCLSHWWTSTKNS